MRLYWLIDTSGSMADEAAIDAVGEMMRSCADVIRAAAARVALLKELLVHAIQFSDDASWVSPALADGVPGEAYTWDAHLAADGESHVGKAIELLADHLKTMPDDAFKPVVVLITDGPPTDDFDAAFRRLLADKGGKKTFRYAVAIGEAADERTEGYRVCKKFCTPQITPLRGDVAEVTRQIGLAMTRAIEHV